MPQRPSPLPPATASPSRSIERGAHTLRVMRGSIVGIDGRDVFVELSPRQQGVIRRDRFAADPALGESFEFTLRGQEQGLWVLELKESLPSLRWETIEVGEVVEARALAVNPGGLELKLGSLHAFMPKAESGLARREDPRLLLGQQLLCEVLDVDPARQRVLLSRKRVLQAARESRRRRSALALRPGAVLPGRVVRLEPFGAIVRLDGDVEGLLHVSNIQREAPEHPGQVLNLGQRLELVVLAVRQGGKRISLGLKQLEPSPWKAFAATYPLGSLVAAEVERAVPFGAFVRLLEPKDTEWLPGSIEGLVHRSECALPEGVHPRQALARGARLCLRVLSVDPERERLSLSRTDPAGRLLDWRQVEQIAERLEQAREAQRRAEAGRPAGGQAPPAPEAALIDGSAAFQRADPRRSSLFAALERGRRGAAGAG
jgi:small subunit ribosomal protein S1